MEGAQCNPGIGMSGRQGNGCLQRILDLAAQPLCQRLAHADALAVAAQCVGMPVPGVGVGWLLDRLGLGALGHLHEQIKAGFFLGLKVVGVNCGGLVGHRDARPACAQARCRRLLKFAVVVQGPGLQHGGIVGAGLGIAAVQLAPQILHAGHIKPVVTSMGERGPSGHGVSPR
jgi:hypothetical protein